MRNVFIYFCWKTYYFESVNMDGGIILKLICKKLDERKWIGFILG
jgi:hypothetical protein